MKCLMTICKVPQQATGQWQGMFGEAMLALTKLLIQTMFKFMFSGTGRVDISIIWLNLQNHEVLELLQSSFQLCLLGLF